MEWTQEKLNEIYVNIRKQAMVDEEFRNKLLENPNACIEEAAGIKLPEGMKLHVIESDPSYDATFVLPDLLGDELEEGDLERVAGGISVLAIASACAAAISFLGCPADACAAAVTLK